MNIFGQNQELYFRGDFDPAGATNVNLTQLQEHSFRRPLAANLEAAWIRLQQQGAVHTRQWTGAAHHCDRQSELEFTEFLHWPSSWNQDVSIFKYFEIKERVRLRFTADIFNFFNHPVNNAPNKTTGLINLSQQANDPRIVQFSLRLEF